MKDQSTEQMSELARNSDATNREMQYHPSIRALVKILARRAAEEKYDELLRAMKNGDANIDKD